MWNGAEKRVNSPLRVMGVAMIIASTVQMGISSRAYDLTHYSLGSWWAGMVVFLCGVCAILCQWKYAAAGSLIFCVLGFIFSFVGSLDDGINSTVFRDFDTCYNPATKVIYGEQISNHTIHCMSKLVASQEEYTKGYNCVCAANGHHEQRKCIDVRLQHNSHNCEVLMTQMPALLLASCMMLLLLLLLVMFYCCLACKCVDFSDQTSVMPEVPVHTSAAYSEVCDVGICEMGEIGDGSDLEAPTVIIDSGGPSPVGTICMPGNSVSSGGSSRINSGNSGGNTSDTSTAYPVERNGSLTLQL